MNEVSQVERFLSLKTYFLVRDDKHVIVQVFARFGKYQGLFGLAMQINTNHGSTKLALIFSRIEQKPTQLHIIGMSCVYFFLKIARDLIDQG